MSKWLLLVLFVFSFPASAYQCKESSCSDIRWGLGTFYNRFDFSANPEFNNVGGYFAASLGKYWKWFALSANVNLGIGSTNITSNIDTTTKKDVNGFITFGYFMGANLGSLQTPFLLSLALHVDWHDLAWNNTEHKLSMSMPFIGFNAAGHVSVHQNIDIEYQAGYSYLFSGHYVDRHGYANRSTLNGGHRFEAAIGMLYKRNANNFIQLETENKVDFYLRFKGIYYQIGASDSVIINSQASNYPASANFMLLLEFGIASNFNYYKYSKYSQVLK
ncbi:hypothetical protein CQA66_08910 [Helicobacter aurati]|uniref:Outer membrane beta-barrel protein n=1 Tax=Helicobacter aurati TaxID=137778 RepID=A0A3D8IWR0_9HELI|nr:hypothetical protein [Helicobacter aurati]RDU69719.1 hypothetical protein CQA66_08910 [Helicobacter aurati]